MRYRFRLWASKDYGRLRRWGSIGFIVGAVGSGFIWSELGISPLDLGIILSISLSLLIAGMPIHRSVSTTYILPALRALAGDRALLWLLVAAALHFAAHVGSTSFLAVHLKELGYPEYWTGIILTMGVSVEIVLMSRSRSLLKRFSPSRIFLQPCWSPLPDGCSPQWSTVLGYSFSSKRSRIHLGAFWLAGVALISSRAPVGVETSAQGLLPHPWAA